MSIEKLEKQVAQNQARLTEISSERSELERAPERAERQLTEAQTEEDRLSADIRAHAQGSSAENLAAAMRETAALKATLEKLKREAGPKLGRLNAEESRLQAELAKTTRDLAKARLGDVVARYEAALRQALPMANEVRDLARKAGVTLPPPDEPSVLIERGTHVLGGLVIELR